MISSSKKTIILFIVGIMLALSLATSVSAHEGEHVYIFNRERLKGEEYVIVDGIPVIEFNLEALASSASVLWESTDHMQYHLDQAVAGSKESCAEVVNIARLVYRTTAFHEQVPARYVKAYVDYEKAVLHYFNSVDPSVASCFNSGVVSNFEYGVARSGLDVTRNFLEPYFNED